MSKSKRCLVEIQVEGRLDANWTEWLEGLKVTHVGSRTLLNGEVRDQAALYGLIAKLRDLGVELVSVENREIKERPEGRGCISPN